MKGILGCKFIFIFSELLIHIRLYQGNKDIFCGYSLKISIIPLTLHDDSFTPVGVYMLENLLELKNQWGRTKRGTH
jgi:hypothetical protein